MIRIALADDHKIIRDGIRSLLTHEPIIEIAGEAADGTELLHLLADTEVDIVLLDINMPGMDGFETASQIHRQYPHVKVLVLSMLDHENYISRMLNAGAMGYVLKNAGREELLFAIQALYLGKKYICTDIALNLLNRLQQLTRHLPAAEPAPIGEPVPARETGDLSKREVEVLQLIAQGFTNAEIADKLYTSKRTIETHRQNLLEKTRSNNTATLIKFAFQHGLIESE